MDDGGKQIDNINQDMGGNITNMQRVNTKIKHIISESSNCCLVTIILVEIVSIVLILVFL